MNNRIEKMTSEPRIKFEIGTKDLSFADTGSEHANIALIMAIPCPIISSLAYVIT